MKTLNKNVDWLGVMRKHIAQFLLVVFVVFFTAQRPDVFLTVDNCC